MSAFKAKYEGACGICGKAILKTQLVVRGRWTREIPELHNYVTHYTREAHTRTFKYAHEVMRKGEGSMTKTDTTDRFSTMSKEELIVSLEVSTRKIQEALLEAEAERAKPEEFTLSLTSDELDWLFRELFQEAINGYGRDGGVGRWGWDAINIRNQWKEQVNAQGYQVEEIDVS